MTLLADARPHHGSGALGHGALQPWRGWARLNRPPAPAGLFSLRPARGARLAPAYTASPVTQQEQQAAEAPPAADPEPQVQEQQPQAQSQSKQRPPLALCQVITLAPQPSLAAALQQLSVAVQGLPAQYGTYASGLVRIEVPVPRGCAPLWWLRGQGAGPAAALSAGARLLYPRIYFSPRRSTAADTEGSTAAGAAARGAGSAAGAGAAWLWQGRPGEPLGEAAMRDMQRFLSTASPRVRAFGGARFDAAQAPAEEWREFGSYCFFIPRVEYMEASGCNLLACTVAWDAAHASSSSTSSTGSPSAAVGFSSSGAAVADALSALHALQPPAPPAAGIFKLERGGHAHTPDSQGWGQLMEGVHADLNAAAAAAAEARAAQQALADPETSPEAEGHGEVWLPREDMQEVVGDDINACTPLLKVSPEAAREEYLLNGQEGLDDLLAALDGGFEAFSTADQAEGLTKVVLARRTDITLRGQLDPLALLEALQERDPRAYQLLVQLPSGATFLGSTPECLYTRTGRAVASEAVAGTRARGAGGDVEKDFWLAFDLLRSHKDHEEFVLVRDWVRQALSGVCSEVQVDVAKSVLKQGAVQHLYGKLSAQLDPGRTDADLLQALHPTPAVCGRPREDALQRLAATEPFDRGYYAGPFGWVSQDAAEFVVAIRSALVHSPESAPALGHNFDAPEAEEGPQAAAGWGRVRPGSPVPQDASVGFRGGAEGPAAPALGREQRVSLYAGVGVVRGSDTHMEWSELDLKMRQFERLLQTVPRLSQAPNINALWASLAVEELCRLGCNTFCVAPGSRSSPLTVAIAQHPRARVVLCIDERSLGFWALGFGRARGRPAVVVTSSGTAVANLLPAVVEASQSNVPMLMLTADRPAELRDTAANQTIDQVKIFGSYTRWCADLPAAADAMPARSLLSNIDNAVRVAAAGSRPGPVHINCQFREPLAPTQADWSRACLQGLERWELSSQPFTTHSSLPALPLSSLQTPLAALPSPFPTAELAGASTSSSLAAAAAAAGGQGLGQVLVQGDLLASLLPEAAAALSAVLGARRGLLVVGELTNPEDVVAAAQLARLLRWPVAADILSGLRAGVQEADPSLSLISHMDHLLLGGKEQWGLLRPDVVLQLGGHLTSKRLCQFLEWCALPGSPAEGGSSSSSSGGGSGDGSRGGAGAGGQPACSWVFVDRHAQRHDQSWLLSHRVEAPLPLFAAAAAAMLPAATAAVVPTVPYAARKGQQQQAQHVYAQLLRVLDQEVGRAVDEALEELGELSEPHIARMLAQELPPGEGLFVGNSMPIRDLDMYARPAAPSAAPQSAKPQGVLPSGVGAPVAANRGASGIDGVLSTAAGFADGLGRGTTLVVGDLSFLHDINGLNLLRSGEMRPPLTVILINNGGGGIFSFLPIADAVPEDVFTPLWATPQHVDLAGMCRAQGIVHLKVSTAEELRTAMRSAWSLNRHSVIEVVTDRGNNVDNHRKVQAAAQQAMTCTLPLLQRWQALWLQQQQQQLQRSAAAGGPAAAVAATQALAFMLRIEWASYEPFSLPLARPLTTADGPASHRQGFLLRVAVSIPGHTAPAAATAETAAISSPKGSVSSNGSSSTAGSNGSAPLQSHTNGAAKPAVAPLGPRGTGGSGVAAGGLAWGVGEVAPLPGLSAESAQQAEQQLVMLCELLRGAELPLTAALLGGRLSEWLEGGLGMGPGALHPSVRAGLEAALLSALAQSLGMPLSQLLSPASRPPSPASSPAWVAVNGLLDGHGSPQEAAAAAVELVRRGHTALKLKVGRRGSPLEDAAAVLAVRQAVGPSIVLRADCNRGWSLEDAVQFGRAAAGADLEYIEEPMQSVHDVAEFHRLTGVPVALDETVDEGLVGPGNDNDQAWQQEGVAALVLKPSVLGGIESTLRLAEWAQRHGMRAVVSSAFESPLGLSLWAQLAAAVDAREREQQQQQQGQPASPTHHGLATLDWFAQPVQLGCGGGSSGTHKQEPLIVAGHSGMGIALSTVQSIIRQQAEALAQAPEGPGPVRGGAALAVAGRPLRRASVTVTACGAMYTLSMLHTPGALGEALEGLPGHSPGTAPARSPAPAPGATTTVFLHGFLGSAEDWAPFMEALASGGSGRRCIAIDLPGHGATLVESCRNAGALLPPWTAEEELVQEAYSLEASAFAVAAAVQQLPLEGPCAVVGYSLGARLALLLAARWPALFQKAVLISGTPGIPGAEQRAERAARDESLASALRQAGVEAFLESWYQQPLWESLRAHPRFPCMLSQRKVGNARELSTALASMSPGRAPSLWAELRQHTGGSMGGRPSGSGASSGSKGSSFSSSSSSRSSSSSSSSTALWQANRAASPAESDVQQQQQSQAQQTQQQKQREAEGEEEAGGRQGLPRLLVVVGERDAKFVQLGQRMCEVISGQPSLRPAGCDGEEGEEKCREDHAALQVVPGCGHAVHVERPLELLDLLDDFI